MPLKLNRRNLVKSAAGVVAGGLLPGLFETLAHAADLIRVGVIIPGSISDRGWMESAFNGMKGAQSAFGDKIKITSIENVAMADMEQALTALAGRNALVVGAGGQCETAGYAVAKRFPNVKFSVIGGGGAQPLVPNFVVTDGRQAQIAYLAGVVAATLTKTGVVSFVGGIELPPIVNASIEFGKGAKAVKPDIKYFPAFTGDFDDVAKSKEATLAAISQGADIHYHILNLGLRGLEQAAREKGTKIIGSYSDRCGADPVYVAFSVTGTGFMVKDQIKKFLDGSWQAGFLPYGLKEGPEASNIALCEPMPELTALIEKIKADLISGKIETLPS
jgi:basic membrane protein A